MRLPKLFRFFLSELVLLFFCYAAFLWFLQKQLHLNLPAAFGIAAFFSALGAFGFLALATKFSSWPRALLLVTCLLLSYGIAIPNAPSRTLPGTSSIYAFASAPQTYLPQFAKDQHADVNVISAGSSSSEYNGERHHDFHYTLVTTPEISRAVLERLRAALAKRLRDEKYDITSETLSVGSGLEFGYRRAFLRGSIRVHTLRKSETEQVWYGYSYETLE